MEFTYIHNLRELTPGTKCRVEMTDPTKGGTKWWAGTVKNGMVGATESVHRLPERERFSFTLLFVIVFLGEVFVNWDTVEGKGVCTYDGQS
jgi:hypothetical protein